MSCGGSCGGCCDTTDYEKLLILLENMINDMIAKGTLQAGLLKCDGVSKLQKDSHIPLCEELKDIIQDLIDDNDIKIPYPTKLEFDDNAFKLKLTLNDNSVLEVDLSALDTPFVESGSLAVVVDGVTGTTTKTIRLVRSDAANVDIDVSALVTKLELDEAVGTSYQDCNGADLVGDEKLVTCENLEDYKKVVQPKLLGCDGLDLPLNTKVVSCDGLTESIRKFIEDGSWSAEGTVTIKDPHIIGGTLEDVTMVNPKFENLRLGVDCEGNDITTCCEVPLVTCDYLHDKFLVATDDVPELTEESHVPTTYYGSRAVALGAPETFMEVTISGEQYLIPVYKKG